MAADKSLTVSDICQTLGIGRTTFYRYVKAGKGNSNNLGSSLLLALIHPSAWNRNSANFAFWGFLRSSHPQIATWHTKIRHLGDAPSTSCLLLWWRWLTRRD